MAAEFADARLRPRPRRDCCAPACCELAADDHVLLLSMHHIVSDGWSVGILSREIAAFYARFTRGDAELPEPPSCRCNTPISRPGSWPP